MAASFKCFFNDSLVRDIARDFVRVHPPFPVRSFVAQSLRELQSLELMQRAAQISEALRTALPKDFPHAARIVLASLGPELDSTDEFGMAPLRYLPHILFVQNHGLDHFEDAMSAQYELTKRFSAEFSIRPYLVKYPEKTLSRLREWVHDENPHVRRLVSEGTRPRLPWASRLTEFQRDPAPVLELLERLKDDPVRYVQRSVANNLNDIAKDHPDHVVAVCAQWTKDAPAGRRWIIGHALRSLIKATHPGALRLMGASKAPKVRVGRIKIAPSQVKRGGNVQFAFDLVNNSARGHKLLVDYVVHFVKANGSTRPKVFKLRKLVVAPRATVRLSCTLSFADLTTRRHHLGPHRIELLINGSRHELGVVRLTS